MKNGAGCKAAHKGILSTKLARLSRDTKHKAPEHKQSAPRQPPPPRARLRHPKSGERPSSLNKECRGGTEKTLCAASEASLANKTAMPPPAPSSKSSSAQLGSLAPASLRPARATYSFIVCRRCRLTPSRSPLGGAPSRISAWNSTGCGLAGSRKKGMASSVLPSLPPAQPAWLCPRRSSPPGPGRRLPARTCAIHAGLGWAGPAGAPPPSLPAATINSPAEGSQQPPRAQPATGSAAARRPTPPPAGRVAEAQPLEGQPQRRFAHARRGGAGVESGRHALARFNRSLSGRF